MGCGRATFWDKITKQSGAKKDHEGFASILMPCIMESMFFDNTNNLS
jgi:hypothetical protein